MSTANTYLEVVEEAPLVIGDAVVVNPNPALPGSELAKWNIGRWAMRCTLVVADLSAVLGIANIMFLVFRSQPAFSLLMVVALCGGFLAVFGISGLYDAQMMHPAHEIKRISVATTAFFVSALVSGAVKGVPVEVYAMEGLAGWLLALVFIPFYRVSARVLFSRFSWWGIPVVVMASGNHAREMVRTLQRWPELGFRPVGILRDETQEVHIQGMPVLGKLKHAAHVARNHGVPAVIVSLPDMPARAMTDMLRRLGTFFKHVYVAPHTGISAMWTTTPAESLVGFKVHNQSDARGMQFAKRLVDIVLAGIGLFFLAPLTGLIIALIRFDSEGPIFYHQLRMGRNGRCFRVIKFRTMYVKADERLQELLKANRSLREEYALYHKLRYDPRVTPIGRVLRRYSLDELPQLWNVLIGEMSLIGPRAYTPNEISAMHGLERSVLQARPGITGLWQVSGRNKLSFEERVYTDVHYVHNWTIWLDFYVLIRTVPVVVTGDGAS